MLTCSSRVNGESMYKLELPVLGWVTHCIIFTALSDYIRPHTLDFTFRDLELLWMRLMQVNSLLIRLHITESVSRPEMWLRPSVARVRAYFQHSNWWLVTFDWPPQSWVGGPASLNILQQRTFNEEQNVKMCCNNQTKYCNYSHYRLLINISGGDESLTYQWHLKVTTVLSKFKVLKYQKLFFSWIINNTYTYILGTVLSIETWDRWT